MARKQSSQPEDIFEEVDKTPQKRTRAVRSEVPVKPQVFQQQSQPVQSQSASTSPKRIKFLLIILAPLIIISGAAVLVASGVFGTDSNINDDVVVNTTPTAATNTDVTVNAATGIVETVEIPTVNVDTTDSDGDGLTDEEEKGYGTNVLQADSDGDGLYDYEEIMVYKTNPNVIDSDGDGHLDGEEVADGYDPNGPGLLLDINAAIETLP